MPDSVAVEITAEETEGLEEVGEGEETGETGEIQEVEVHRPVGRKRKVRCSLESNRAGYPLRLWGGRERE